MAAVRLRRAIADERHAFLVAGRRAAMQRRHREGRRFAVLPGETAPTDEVQRDVDDVERPPLPQLVHPEVVVLVEAGEGTPGSFAAGVLAGGAEVRADQPIAVHRVEREPIHVDVGARLPSHQPEHADEESHRQERRLDRALEPLVDDAREKGDQEDERYDEKGSRDRERQGERRFLLPRRAVGRFRRRRGALADDPRSDAAQAGQREQRGPHGPRGFGPGPADEDRAVQPGRRDHEPRETRDQYPRARARPPLAVLVGRPFARDTDVERRRELEEPEERRHRAHEIGPARGIDAHRQAQPHEPTRDHPHDEDGRERACDSGRVRGTLPRSSSHHPADQVHDDAEGHQYPEPEHLVLPISDRPRGGEHDGREHQGRERMPEKVPLRSGGLGVAARQVLPDVRDRSGEEPESQHEQRKAQPPPRNQLENLAPEYWREQRDRDRRHDHEPIEQDVANHRRDQRPRVGGQEPKLRRHVVAVRAQHLDLLCLVLRAIDGGSERVANAFSVRLLAVNPGREPASDVPAAGHRREVGEAFEKSVQREALQHPEGKGRAPNAAARDAERGALRTLVHRGDGRSKPLLLGLGGPLVLR